MNTRTRLVSIVLGLSLIGQACSKDGSSNNNIDCSTSAQKSYAADVDPIIQSTCNRSGCHDIASVNGPGPLTNYNQVFNARTSIREAVRTGLMPQNTTLTLAQKTSIVCWIDSGGQNN